jgi:hypothetical protein
LCSSVQTQRVGWLNVGYIAPVAVDGSTFGETLLTTNSDLLINHSPNSQRVQHEHSNFHF